mmetsp:Transcript_33286/g.87596  ORF Transcript_33286/g.87596 Transcript_33286/m.87596 type:complete len:97 (+) Transcript_33286:286-576(+)
MRHHPCRLVIDARPTAGAGWLVVTDDLHGPRQFEPPPLTNIPTTERDGAWPCYRALILAPEEGACTFSRLPRLSLCSEAALTSPQVLHVYERPSAI